MFVDNALTEKWRLWLQQTLKCPLLTPRREYAEKVEGREERGEKPTHASPIELSTADDSRTTNHDPRFTIGICWQGNPNHRLDRYRSIPLKMFRSLARVPGVRLVSLQKGPGAAQIRDLNPSFPIWEPGQSEPMTAEALLDTAALMKNLDLVISVDTGTAHLAGALGVPVWVPLSAIGEWRWLLKREDSPWYPTMRLFRQKKLGQWRLVFRRMARELAALVRVKK